MCVRGPNIAVPRFGDPIVQKKCWELLVQKFDRFQTLHNYTPNNMQQGVQKEAKCNIQQRWELLANNVASPVRTGLQLPWLYNTCLSNYQTTVFP